MQVDNLGPMLKIPLGNYHLYRDLDYPGDANIQS